MSEMLLVNPRRRKRRRKMSALQRKYFGKRRRRSSGARARRRNPSHLLAMNPRRRRRRGASVSRRRRRNPSLRGFGGGIVRQIVPTVKSGFTGALGALGLDVLMGFVGTKLPTALQTGFAKDAVKVLGGVLVGVAGNMVLKGRGRELATGAVTVALHDLLKAQLQAMNTGLPLGELGYMNPGAPLGAYLEDHSGASGYGAYVEDGAAPVGDYEDDDI